MADGYPLIPEELPGQFRAAMRRLAASVAIVAAMGPDGPVGMAATSITSLTVDPPAVLVCVNRATVLHGLLVPTAGLSVNLLARHQQDVSAAFGGGMPQDQRFGVGAQNWVLADVEGLDQRGLAAALETSEGAVESLRVRARQRLRADLAEFRADWRTP